MVGFVHVGFAPTVKPGEQHRSSGIVSMLMTTSHSDSADIAAGLLKAGESVLQELGAVEFLGGGCGVHAPFYLGRYGGCRLPGVLVDDTPMSNALRAAGYVEHRECFLWHRALATFRPPVDRDLIALRRQFRLQPISEDPIRNWNDACAYSWVDPIPFGIDAIAGGTRSAALTFWNMEPLASGWGQRAIGLADIAVHQAPVRPSLLACFLGEAMRQFQTEGVSLVEIQTAKEDAELAEACRKLGFSEIDRGIQFRKQA